uniref:Uncharacterized protein n=1 Tax=Pithovirus LCDPAC01 TaxID=2506600 RepID=A0A481YMZ7_9VIRU|nr:MAG: hypothetical protein LCDPAC01_01910 [Pithovirus LCDPAC01]
MSTNARLEKFCRDLKIPVTSKGQELLTVKQKVAFCLKHNIREFEDYEKVFGFLHWEFVNGIYSLHELDTPHCWFIELSGKDIKELELKFPESFNQKFYRGTTFYFHWLINQGMYTAAIKEVDQYGWTIISENALCLLVKKTNDINKRFHKFGLLTYFMGKVDTSSDEYYGTPFLIEYYHEPNLLCNGTRVIETAFWNFPLDMAFMLFENREYKLKGSSEIFKILLERKLSFRELISSFKRLIKKVKLPLNFYSYVVGQYKEKIFDEKELFELVKWSSKYLMYGFYSFYWTFREKIFDSKIPDGSKLWIDWLRDRGFMNPRVFKPEDVFHRRYDLMTDALNKLPKDRVLAHRLFKFLLDKKYLHFPDYMMEEAIGHHHVESAELFRQTGYGVVYQRCLWVTVMTPSRNLSSYFFTYMREKNPNEKKKYSEAVEILLLPSVIWLYGHFPFTEVEFYDLADLFSKIRCNPVVYKYMYEKDSYVKFNNDDSDGFWERRDAKRYILKDLPESRKELKEIKGKFQDLLTEEKKLSDFIKMFVRNDTEKVDKRYIYSYFSQEEKKRYVRCNYNLVKINSTVAILKELRQKKIRITREKIHKMMEKIYIMKTIIRKQCFKVENCPLEGTPFIRYSGYHEKEIECFPGYTPDDDVTYFDFDNYW